MTKIVKFVPSHGVAEPCQTDSQQTTRLSTKLHRELLLRQHQRTCFKETLPFYPGSLEVPAPAIMSRSDKRKRTDETSVASKKQKQTPPASKSVPSRSIVRGDALRWNPVPLPDRLDDAEGFYNLEEIDDVEVVRDERDHVMFRAKHTNDDQAPALGEQHDEWEGLGDDGSHQKTHHAVETLPVEPSRPKATGSKPLKPILKRRQDELQDLPFDALDQTSGHQPTDVSAWEDLGLSDSMLSAVSGLRFQKPTAIQASAIPPITEGKDVIGKAVTGSGKTLAFGIPILERWLVSSGKVGVPIALILAPTRELAHQLHEHLMRLGEGLEAQPRIVRVTGGLSILKQQRQLERADVIIGTPGRLWDVINDSQGLITRLNQIEFLVVDEADRLLSEGHFKEVEDIIDTLDREVINEDDENETKQQKRKRQILVFSATFHKNLHQKLAGKLKAVSNSNLLTDHQSLAYLLQKLPFRSKPLFLDSNPTSQMSEHLNESIVESPAMEKDLYLYALLLQNANSKTLVFTNSISSVKRLSPLFQNLSLPAIALHSSMPQKSRLRSLERFTGRNQHRNILIATDVAARGLDIKGIDLIIHYHVPRAADMYVHRSGRTARAEQSGRSILLCSPDEVVPTSRLITKVHGTGKAPDMADIDREIIKRLRKRVELAQKIVEAEQAREKLSSKDGWLKKAADELGVDYDSDDFEEEGRKSTRGRGGGKAKMMKEKAGKGKEEVGRWKAELKELLGKRVNMGVSERYLAGGKVDVDAILDGRTGGLFLEGR
jgi:ATP-dependent RNA helicase DDX24/MAK5